MCSAEGKSSTDQEMEPQNLPLDPTINGESESVSGYEELMDQYSTVNTPREGDVVTGKVLKVGTSEVVVDIGYKSEGVVPLQEFMRPDGSIAVSPSDEIDVMVESARSREGEILLSHEKAERLGTWEQIEQAFRDQAIVNGVVTDKVKGGLSVDIGVKAFLPGSLADIASFRNLERLIGSRIDCKVIKINRRRRNVVLSRKAVLEQQLAELRRDLLENLKEGVVLQGTVKNITDYGVFVDLGGIDGLLHISDISWGRTGHPSKLFEKGEQISVKVLQFDRQNERVSLGFKQLQPDPWTEVSRKYHVGSKVAGTVVSVTDYGVFLEIEQGVEGLIHISEMSWSKHPRSPKRAFSVGDQLEAVVLNLDVERKRLSLGLRQLKPDPWAVLADTCSVGSIVRGTVRNLTDFGAFVEVAEGVDGLIHISDLAWSHQVRHPSDLLKKGQEVRSVVLHMDTVNHRLSLGIKQLHTEAWERFFSVHHVHDTVTGKVSRLTPFGAFVELAGGIEALCHQSQMREPPAGSQPLSIGDVRTFKIIKLQPTEKKIGLSLEAERPTPPDQQVTPEIQKATAQAAAKTRSADSALRSDSFDRT